METSGPESSRLPPRHQLRSETARESWALPVWTAGQPEAGRGEGSKENEGEETGQPPSEAGFYSPACPRWSPVLVIGLLLWFDSVGFLVRFHKPSGSSKHLTINFQSHPDRAQDPDTVLLNLASTWLCDVGRIDQPLWAPASSSAANRGAPTGGEGGGTDICVCLSN